MTLLYVLAAWLTLSAALVLGYQLGLGVGRRQAEDRLRQSGRMWLVRLESDDVPAVSGKSYTRRASGEWRQ